MQIPKDKYLFICGCARSGTSVTTELIRRHPAIAMGRERFNSLFKNNKRLFTPSLFRADRFCRTLLPGDSHHQKLSNYYSKVYANWEGYSYYGDKIPSLFKAYDYVVECFDGPKFIYLLRDIFDVSQSWENRRLHSIQTNGKWPHDKGYLKAIQEWNLSLKNTILAKEKHPNNIFIFSYSNLFEEQKYLDKLFVFLNLKVTVRVNDFWHESKLKKVVIEQGRNVSMPLAVKEKIYLQADFSSYRKLKELANS